jgi:SH3-like domain-containing protein
LTLVILLAPATARAQTHALVKAKQYLTLRSEPVAGATVLDRLLRFQPVKVLERKDKWARVKTIKADPKESKTGWVLASYLSENGFVTVSYHSEINVRRGPGLEYAKIMHYKKPYPIFVLDVARNGWLKVLDFDGDRGWVHPNMVDFKPRYVMTKLRHCNIREAGGEDYQQHRIVFTAERKVYLQVLGEKDGWLHVRHADGDEGWISAKIVWGWLDEKIPKPDED